jgi:DNA-binding Lrp family transcriptional regulator
MGTSKPGPHPRVSDEEILAVLREADSPVLSTADLAESLPIARRTALNRLKQLRERGVVESYTVGGRNTVWWATDSAVLTSDIESAADRLDGFGAFADNDEFVEEVERVREELREGFEERQRDLFGN